MLRRSVAAILGAVLCSGCASYTHVAMGVREPMARGDFAGARAFLEEQAPKGGKLPYLMELGLVLRYQEQFVESNRVFDRAELIVDDLYTKSLTKEALALITSDETIPYDGEMWERVLINYYRALNYVDLGEFEDALVECRKINHKLKVYVDSSERPPTYRTDAFAQYLTALLFEAGGELNDAWVSLRLAAEAYEHYSASYAVAAPASLASDLLRLADQQGYRDDMARLRERYPDATFVPTSQLLGQGEIVFFYEEGFVPAKAQREITIPILKTERETDQVALAHSLADRAYVPITYKKSELLYLLRVALPAYPPPVPADAPGHAILTVGETSSRTAIAEDLHAIARHGLEDRMPAIVFKTILRALVKWGVKEAIEKESEIAAAIFNIFSAAAEKADTRAWITLPGTIQIARLVVPPGEHDVEVKCVRADGRTSETVRFQDVSVGPGEVRFLSHRSF